MTSTPHSATHNALIATLCFVCASISCSVSASPQVTAGTWYAENSPDTSLQIVRQNGSNSLAIVTLPSEDSGSDTHIAIGTIDDGIAELRLFGPTTRGTKQDAVLTSWGRLDVAISKCAAHAVLYTLRPHGSGSLIPGDHWGEDTNGQHDGTGQSSDGRHDGTGQSTDGQHDGTGQSTDGQHDGTGQSTDGQHDGTGQSADSATYASSDNALQYVTAFELTPARESGCQSSAGAR